jgi:hypothetical protein
VATYRDAAPLVDWLPPEDSDFPERDAEIFAVLDTLRGAIDEACRLVESDQSPELAHLLGTVESLVFGPYTCVEIEEAD